ncbi:MAG: phosphate acyltransferase PlsX [Hydrogenibacillus sp.]|nr:phosphate acyltransferase PlsX [Hydrogenibacillus sp.]
MRIALDALGGDHAPQAVVAGAEAALERFSDLSIVLVGPPEAIEAAMSDVGKRHRDGGRLLIHAAAERIAVDEEPTRAVRQKTDSSLVQMIYLVRDGAAEAAVSAGSTGALLAAGLLCLGRLSGVLRPALAPIMPTTTGRGVLVLDVGATSDGKPEYIRQHAVLASRYAEAVLGWARPRVGLLNVGTEAAKGNALAKAAYTLLREAPVNFIGNIEARDVLFGAADIVVTDGFTGNVFLKATEGAASAILSMLKDALQSGVRSKLGALLLMPELKRLRLRLDYAAYGGTPLLGLTKPLIKAHGSSGPEAIAQAITEARAYVERGVGEALARELSAFSTETKSPAMAGTAQDAADGAAGESAENHTEGER